MKSSCCVGTIVGVDNDQPLIQIGLQKNVITSKKYMKVLGVVFDSKLNWQLQVASAISKAKNSLYSHLYVKSLDQ